MKNLTTEYTRNGSPLTPTVFLPVDTEGELTAQAATHAARQSRILLEIAAERAAQDARFGVQDLPDGTRADRFRPMADLNRRACDDAFSRGEGTYRHVFLEEVYEALAESDPAKLRAELIQAVAVGVKWIEGIDRREGR